MLQLIGPDVQASRALTLLRVELAQASGQAGKGWAVLEPLRKDNSRVLLMMRGQLAMAGSDIETARRAAEALQTHLTLEPRDAGAWSLEAQLWERLGQPLRAVRALGEARAAAGDLNGAIDRMRSGLNLSRSRDADQVEAAVIDARLRSLLYERRQLLAQMYPRGIPPGTELPRLQGQALSPRLGLN
jgi:predicted Zn-dependent protease